MLKVPLADIGLLSLVVSLALFALGFTLFHAGRVLRGNRKFFELVGCQAAEAIGQDARVLIHGSVPPGNCLVTEACHSLQDRVSVREADDPGNRFGRPMEIHQRIIRAADQAPVGILHVIRDLSSQRQAENALKDSEERFRMLSEAAFEGIFIHQNGVVIDVNQPLARSSAMRSMSCLAAMCWNSRQRNTAARSTSGLLRPPTPFTRSAPCDGMVPACRSNCVATISLTRESCSGSSP